ncbi:Hypothetical protein LOCK908_0057 [Lacticaseibacillus rhamnosus LOCK908]|nr:hypothetical protein LRHK_58 [Lacticaseibacillus rhamnosus ATCC 8530]AGP72744.1 Hypothetical protein LOCK908_0057 [Lacticaseibacillus rhamnosus LOCK908]
MLEESILIMINTLKNVWKMRRFESAFQAFLGSDGGKE